MSHAKPDTNLVQSVDRALDIMQQLARHGDLSVTAVAEALGTHKSTASRLLGTLEQRGFVEQISERGNFRLGLAVVHLAGSVRADFDLVRIARPVCESLSEQTEETINLAVLDGDEVINIDQVIGSSSVVSMNWLGRRNPLTCTSTGKVLLAFHDNPGRLLKKPPTRCTEHSVLQFERFEKQLAEIRVRGYGYTLEELELGMNAISAPIRAFTGEVIASLSLSGPSYRVTPERVPELGKLTARAGLEVSTRLGYK